jgi:hypothetical protein
MDLLTLTPQSEVLHSIDTEHLKAQKALMEKSIEFNFLLILFLLRFTSPSEFRDHNLIEPELTFIPERNGGKVLPAEDPVFPAILKKRFAADLVNFSSERKW